MGYKCAWLQDMNEQDQQEYYERLASERAAAEGSHMQGRDQDQTEAQGEGADEAEGKQATGEGSTLSVLRCCRQRPVCAQLGRLRHDFRCGPSCFVLTLFCRACSRAVVVTVPTHLVAPALTEPKAGAKKAKKAKVTITSEEYDQIRELLKLILRREEEGRDVTYPGMLWTDLRNAYLHEVRVWVCEWHCWHAPDKSFVLRTFAAANAALPWRFGFLLCCEADNSPCMLPAVCWV
jgi:hypothetical protein